MDLAFFDGILILLAVGVVVSIIFRRLLIPIIIGYLCVGILVGPHVLGWLPDIQVTRDVAHFGIVFLMFTIGLEFSLKRLVSMKTTVLGYGGLQVVITVGLTTLIGSLLGMTIPQAIIVGSIVAMSSTAIVLKQLSEQLELNLSHGANALGILLFQDLAVIPFLLLVPEFAGYAGASSLGVDLVYALLKGLFAILLILGLGRWVLRPVFHEISRTHSMELFTLCILLVTLGAAWLTHTLHLSLELGAFLAGLMLGETEFRHQIEVDIRPFRDVLLGLFFITIGMQLDVHAIPGTWKWILLLLSGLVFFKFVLISVLGLCFGKTRTAAIRTGLVLAQGGEFGFAIIALALSYKLLPNDYGQVVVSALLLSMVISPILIRFNGKITKTLFASFEKGVAKVNAHELEQQVKNITDSLDNHIIICGYGRVGQNIARFLEQEGFGYMAIDSDPHLVSATYRLGDNVAYGNASHLGILEAAGIRHAKALAISFTDTDEALKIIEQVRRLNSTIPILVRSRDESELEAFQQKGATAVIPEVLETSLIFVSHLFVMYGVSKRKISLIMDEVRKNHYDLLREVFLGDDEVGPKEDLESE